MVERNLRSVGAQSLPSSSVLDLNTQQNVLMALVKLHINRTSLPDTAWGLIFGVDNDFYFLVKAPFLVDLKKPELKIPHTVNFYLTVEPRVMLGIWHTVPSCRAEDAKGKDRGWYEAALRDGNPIIVYLHGSAEHRSKKRWIISSSSNAHIEKRYKDLGIQPSLRGTLAQWGAIDHSP
ncbi:hypothetical protein P7K49_018047 [Saguinus oedipus]|uniref:Uncharacterized protein n=1 Tax=Saguinus oedipus TaxID=9490 RepID=A0ABQ9V4K5_SAGOE|nr:hypothetical protein P7K49_018047 [Saguinus oedipus]